MYTFTILRSSPKSLTNFKDMLGPKKVNTWTKNSPKWAGKIFPDLKPQFSKEDYKNSFYTKNKQNSMSRLKDISTNSNVGSKILNN